MRRGWCVCVCTFRALRICVRSLLFLFAFPVCLGATDEFPLPSIKTRELALVCARVSVRPNACAAPPPLSFACLYLVWPRCLLVFLCYAKDRRVSYKAPRRTHPRNRAGKDTLMSPCVACEKCAHLNLSCTCVAAVEEQQPAGFWGAGMGRRFYPRGASPPPSGPH